MFDKSNVIKKVLCECAFQHKKKTKDSMIFSELVAELYKKHGWGVIVADYTEIIDNGLAEIEKTKECLICLATYIEYLTLERDRERLQDYPPKIIKLIEKYRPLKEYVLIALDKKSQLITIDIYPLFLEDNSFKYNDFKIISCLSNE
ncbi:MAG: hypothetical protein QNJ54_01650 [Prochloraceae cyanobacterium]|nr:hypothetical protein [Prochloraceae cyanobacterium]